MKAQKKLLTVILSAVMVFTLATSAISPLVVRTVAGGTTYDYGDWRYTYYDPGYYSFGWGDFATLDYLYGTHSSVVIPSKINGHTVKSINSSIFQNHSEITNLVFSEGITTISSDLCSGLTNLTTVVIPESVTSIGANAFSGCTNLKTVYNFSNLNIVKGATTYGYVAYNANNIYGRNAVGAVSSYISYPTLYIYGGEDMANYTYSSSAPWDEYKANVTRIVIFDGVQSIGNYAFNGFTALESVEIPASVTEIGNYAFRGCSALTDITLAGNNYTVSNYSFLGCNAIETVNLKCGSIDETKFPNYENITFNRTHVYGEWFVKKAPTIELIGTLSRICADVTHVETFELPALDSSSDYVVDVMTGKYTYEKDGQAFAFDYVSDLPRFLGAQYRTEGEAGIRFCTEIFVTYNNGEYTVGENYNATFENIETYGTLIMPLDLIDNPADLVLTANGKIASSLFPSGIEYLNVLGQKYYHKFDNKIQFTAVLVGIPDAAPGGMNYDRDFVAVSYIKYKNGETVYSAPCVRNIEMLVNASV